MKKRAQKPRRNSGAHRRDFLKVVGQGAILAAIGSLYPGIVLTRGRRPASGGNEPHFFLQLNTYGGLDATLGLDPWKLPAGADSQDLFLEYRPEQILVAPSGLKLGPAATSLLPHADACAILNGVMMRRDAGHESLNLYMQTGKGDGTSAALPAEFGSQLGAGPFGVLMQSSLYTASRSVILSSVYDLSQITADGEAVALLELLKLARARSGSPLDLAGEALLNAKDTTVRFAAQLVAARAANGSGETLRDSQVVAAAFASGAAYQGQLDIARTAGQLDTHSNHEGAHLMTQTALWEEVAEIFATFKKTPFGSEGKSLFDYTTFMVCTEFSRTPALNAAKGKDHNPFTNSVLLAGKNVRGGAIVGASKLFTRHERKDGMPLHIASPFDFVAGRVTDRRERASFIFPENVARTVSALFGAPEGPEGIGAEYPVVPGILKS